MRRLGQSQRVSEWVVVSCVDCGVSAVNVFRAVAMATDERTGGGASSSPSASSALTSIVACARVRPTHTHSPVASGTRLELARPLARSRSLQLDGRIDGRTGGLLSLLLLCLSVRGLCVSVWCRLVVRQFCRVSASLNVAGRVCCDFSSRSARRDKRSREDTE